MLDTARQFGHTGVVKLESATARADERAGHRAVPASQHADALTSQAAASQEGHTRGAVVTLLLEDGPITATAIGTRLGLSAAGVRRHLDALIESGEARITTAGRWQQRGRGRPAKFYQLTATGRGRLGHAYDDLAGAAMRQLREIGGEEAIREFARKRVANIVGDVDPVVDSGAESAQAKADEIAESFSSAGFAASTRRVGSGVQICQHHCPVSHVAEEFP